MFGVRGGRRPAAAAFPLAVRRGSAAEGAQKQLPGTAVTGLMTARVTAVMDPASFWAQVGKEETLAEFDTTMAALSQWCQENGARATCLPHVNELVSVKGAESGEWVRARVSRQVSESLIEVYYVDTGTSGRVSLSCVCGSLAPQLCAVPFQALQCSLSGAQPVESGEVWSEEAIARFSELVTGVPVGAGVVSSQGMGLTLQLYVRRGEQWKDVLGILMAEGLAVDEFAEYRVAPEPAEDEIARGGEEECGGSGVTHTPQVDQSKEEEKVEVQEEEKVGVQEEEKVGVQEEENVEVREEEKVGVQEEEKVGVREEEKVGVQEEGVGLAVDKEKGEPEETRGPEEGVAGEGEEVSTVEQVTSRGPLVVKGTTEEEEESASPATSEDEWDDSLLDQSLEPLKDVGYSTEDPFASDPFALPEPDGQRQTRLLTHFSALVGAASEMYGGGRGRWRRGGGGGERRGRGAWNRGGRRGGLHQTQQQGGQGVRDASGGEWKWREKERGGGRGRGGGRQGRGVGRPNNHRSSQEEEGEGVRAPRPPVLSPGGMRGVRVFSNGTNETSKETGRENPQKPALVPKPKDGSSALSPVPPSTRPVTLFSKEGVVKTFRDPALQPTGGETSEGGGGGVGFSIMEMSEDMASKEVEWHYWKLGNHMKKVLAELSPENADSFGSQVEAVLSSHSSAQKLMSIPGSKGPVWPVLSCLLREGAKRKEGTQKPVVVAVRSLAAVLCVDVCAILQPAVEAMAGDVCQPSFTDQSKEAKRLFCTFIGRLFLDAGYSANTDYATAMGKVVRGFLNAWSKCPEKGNEGRLLAEVQCFGHLCRQIGPTLDITNRETLEQYFGGGLVKKHILNEQLAKCVRSSLLDLALERAGGWRKEEKVRGERVRPKARSTPTPPVFSQDTPTVSANGQRVQPVPVSPSGKMNGAVCPITSTSLSSSSVTHHPKMIPQPLATSHHHHPSSSLHPIHSQSAPTQYQQHHVVPADHLLPQQTGEQQSGIQMGASFSEVERMLHVLGLHHLKDLFKNAMFNDSLISVGNMELLHSGLKDAGLHPGEVVSVIDYLERRRQSMPPSPLSPHPSSSSSSGPHSSVSRQYSLPEPHSGAIQSQQFHISRQSSYPENIYPPSPGLPHTRLVTHFSSGNTQPQSFGASNTQPQSFGATNTQPQSFGATNTQPQSFGATNTQPQSFGGTNTQPQSFGAINTQPQSLGATNTQPQSFGASYTQPQSFGASNTQPQSFGATNTQPQSFGASNTQPQSFGASNTQPQSFGATNTQRQSFGATNTQPQSFGASNTQPQSFGASNTQPQSFGATNTQPQSFGASNTQPQSFGATNTQPQSFGAINTQPQSFGATNTQPQSFGATNTQPQSFGATNTQPQSFGASNTQPQSFGASNTQPQSFGASNTQPQSFGASNTQPQSFGATNTQPQPFRPQSVTPQSPALFPRSHAHYPHLSPDNQDQLYRPSSTYPPTPNPRPSSLTPTPHPSSLPSQTLYQPQPATPAVGYSQKEAPPSPAAPSPAVGGVEAQLAGSPAPVRKYGFGQYSCVLCRSKEHSTPHCPDRARLLHQHTSLY